MARTDEPSEITRVEAPAWLTKAAEQDDSMESLRKYRVIPRLKIVQALSSDLLKEAVGPEGTACLAASRQVILRPRDDENGPHVVHVVPSFFFTEYTQWGDLRDRNNPAVIDRSFDPTSRVARRCMDPKLREEEYPGGPPGKPFVYKYVESLNFACVIRGPEDHPAYGNVIIVPFERGDHQYGVGWSNAIMQRMVPGTTTPAPMWSQVWALTVGVHSNRNGQEWPGIDFEAPSSGSPFITQDEVELYRGVFESLREDFRAKRIVVDVGEDDREVDSEVHVEEPSLDEV